MTALRLALALALAAIAADAAAQTNRAPARPPAGFSGIWSLDERCSQTAYLMRIEGGVMDVWAAGQHVSRIAVTVTAQAAQVRIRIDRLLMRAENNPVVPTPGEVVVLRRDGPRLIGVETRRPNGQVVAAPPNTAPLHPCVVQR